MLFRSENNSDHEHNIQLEVERTSEQFAKLVRDAREPLYPNCIKFFKLEFLIKLLHIKTVSRWSQKLFNQILTLIKAALPDRERLPKSYSEAKIYMQKIDLAILLYMPAKITTYYFIRITNK